MPGLLFWLAGLPVLVVVIGLLYPGEARLGYLLGLLPAFVSSKGTVRQTVVAAVWSPLLLTLPVIFGPAEATASNAAVALLSLVLGCWSVVACRQRVDREKSIYRLRSAAAALQRQILRPLPLRTDRLLVDGLYEPVEEDSMVGGDIYEVVVSPYGNRVLIADVQGKGLRAIGTALAVLGAFREAAYWRPDITEVVAALESAVVRHNDFARRPGEQERFVTALVLDIGDGSEACAVNCGHVPLYILDGTRAEALLHHEPGVPLGLGSLAAEPRTPERFDFPARATLLVCTDGVTEARAPSGAFYPLAERLRAWHDVSPDQVIRTLRGELWDYTGGRFRDDVAALALRRGHAAVPA
jgi:serine phosphatase RsbU (regulator of sigma subunit)